MSKNKIVVLASVIILALSVAIAAYIWFRPGRETKKPGAGSEITKGDIFLKEEATPDVLYEDSSGFSIKHAASITIEDLTPEESEFYTLLDLKRGDSGMSIAFKDTEYKSVEDMLEKDSDAPKNTSLIGAASLDGIPMTQYSYNFESKEILLSAAIDKGVLYLIEGPKDEGFWEETQNLIVSTFAFAQKEAPSASSGGQAVIYEAEEVIE